MKTYIKNKKWTDSSTKEHEKKPWRGLAPFVVKKILPSGGSSRGGADGKILFSKGWKSGAPDFPTLGTHSISTRSLGPSA
jgi:hypothetical protein